MNNWKPIKTAPKDGTVVQLKNKHNGLTDAGFWCDYTDTKKYPKWRKELSGIDGEWDQENGNGKMTHWRPLR